MKFLRAITWLWLCWSVSAWAGPVNLITERAWVEDPNGRMTLAQVQQAPEQSLTAAYFNQGFSASVFWVRLRIDPESIATDDADERLIMRIWPPYLDELQLFDPLRQDAQPQITGDLHPQRATDYRSFNLNFVLPRGHAPRDVWLRLKTSTSTLTQFQVVTETEAKAMDWRQANISMTYVAALIICLGWAVMAWVLWHDRLIMYYMAREVVAIVYAVVVLGGLRALTWEWLPPAWINGVGNFLFCFISAIALWFDAQFLAQYRAHPRWLWVLRAGVGLAGLASVLAVLGFTPLALRLNSWVTVLTPLFLLLAVFSTRAWSEATADNPPDFPRWALVGLYLMLPLVLLLNRAVVLGWIPPVVEATHAALMYLLIGSVTMMVLLQVRAFRSYRRQQDVHLRLRLAEQLAHDERHRREEQERFLAMLGHELRNPLAAVGMLADEHSEEGRQIRRAVSDMAQVLERSVQSGRLADDRFVPEILTFDMHDLMHEIGTRSERLDLENFEPDTQAQSDRVCLQIALGNLVDNALKYSPPDSRVQVVCAQLVQDGRDTLRVRVSNAPGVAGLPDAQQIFQKYYRSPKAHHQIGSGLGLYLTKSLLDMLGARISYRPSAANQSPQVVFEVDMPTHPPAMG